MQSMRTCCYRCKKDKGRYSLVELNGKFVWLCHDCRWGPRPVKSPKQSFEELQTPFWKLMGQKPKPKDVQYEKYLKWKNMTYGDAVIERNLKGQYPSAYEKFRKAR